MITGPIWLLDPLMIGFLAAMTVVAAVMPLAVRDLIAGRAVRRHAERRYMKMAAPPGAHHTGTGPGSRPD